MDTLELLGLYGLVPVIVLNAADDATPTADALIAGGLPVMEITLRTAAGLASIRRVAKERPEIQLGAGTVLNLEQAKACVDAGAKFIVSPGFDAKLVEWCVANHVPVTPGCVTPTEIMAALSYGLRVLKFFPAGVYGGLSAMKALSGPFGDVKFIPTGGVNLTNLEEYAMAPFVHAIGGSFVCSKADIEAHEFAKIEATARESMRILMGFSMKHIGVNTESDGEAESIAKAMSGAFGFDYQPGNSSNFAGSGIEIVKGKGLGTNGHIAVATNNIARATAYLEAKGFAVDWDTAKKKGDKTVAVYLKDAFGGFAVHLLQK